MVRILGVNIPDKKVIYVSLTEIFGIGVSTAKKICGKLKIDFNRKTNTLSDEELSNLRNEISKYKIEGDLRQYISKRIAELKEIRCYRGERHKKCLPVRGQRTRSNSRTRRGKRKTVANKKEAKQQG